MEINMFNGMFRLNRLSLEEWASMDLKLLIRLAKEYADYHTKVCLLYGRIKKLPCEVCGRTNSEAHHIDYTQPLDILWLCDEHNKDLHWYTKYPTTQRIGGRVY